jgi:hypothetical protein
VIVDEMELLGRLKDTEPLPPEVSERAKMTLRAAMALEGAPGFPHPGASYQLQPAGDLEPAARRRLRSRRVLAGAAVAAVLLGGAAYIASRATSTSSTPRSGTIAYLTARAVTAAADASADVINARTTTSSGSAFDDWFGPGSGPIRSAQYWSYGPSGQLESDTSYATSSVTSVDYLDHTWWTVSGAAPRPLPPAAAAQAALFAGSPAELRALLQSAGANLAPDVTVDGQRAVTLTTTLPAGATLTFSFSEQSYQLLEVRLAGNPRPDADYETSYTYLAPTTASLANLKITIPHGFTKVSPPALPALNGGIRVSG